jgi:hypothetical protein
MAAWAALAILLQSCTPSSSDVRAASPLTPTSTAAVAGSTRVPGSAADGEPTFDDAIRNALENRIDRLEQEVGEAWTEAAKWETLADRIGYRSQGADYGWSHAPVRPCGSDVFGDVEASSLDIRVGALTLSLARQYESMPASDFEGQDGRFGGSKMLAIVDEGRRVLVTVGESSADSVSLTYAFRREPDRNLVLYPIAAGEQGVILEGCSGRETQFDGGVFVGGPQCVDLDVYFAGSTDRHSVTLGFARTGC